MRKAQPVRAGERARLDQNLVADALDEHPGFARQEHQRRGAAHHVLVRARERRLGTHRPRGNHHQIAGLGFRKREQRGIFFRALSRLFHSRLFIKGRVGLVHVIRQFVRSLLAVPLHHHHASRLPSLPGAPRASRARRARLFFFFAFGAERLQPERVEGGVVQERLARQERRTGDSAEGTRGEVVLPEVRVAGVTVAGVSDSVSESVTDPRGVAHELVGLRKELVPQQAFVRGPVFSLHDHLDRVYAPVPLRARVGDDVYEKPHALTRRRAARGADVPRLELAVAVIRVEILRDASREPQLEPHRRARLALRQQHRPGGEVALRHAHLPHLAAPEQRRGDGGRRVAGRRLARRSTTLRFVRRLDLKGINVLDLRGPGERGRGARASPLGSRRDLAGGPMHGRAVGTETRGEPGPRPRVRRPELGPHIRRGPLLVRG